ncbi:glycoside hydrolase [Fervidicella metallireducens AeB]|uniref:Glycoside hydrolase n=1 Tax=Fervidicella metallireducens AeB TaxID=1403537 RepID=A0A017RV85_9CLOT|nr:glycosyl hydrolase family 18 protein [Fervidicella metallireducens]EYE88557.1 glycoside hydrolase [Fervidicella metallireducens AeB]
MILHVVKPGESLYSISKLYGVDMSKIIKDNEMMNPNNLVVGQTIVVLEGLRKHKVMPGQSLYSIGKFYGVNTKDLLSANPDLGNVLMPGQVINIPDKTKKLGTIEVNGYAFPNIDMNVLMKTLPNLTYLSIFSYEVRRDGTLKEINDLPLINEAKKLRVAPLMVISNIEEGKGFSSDIAHEILTNNVIQNKLIENVVNVLKEKSYYGLDVDFEYIYPYDRENYIKFLRKMNERLKPLGYTLTVALAPKTSGEQKGLLYEAHDYPSIGKYVSHVILMTYEWGYTYGPAMAVAPINEVKKVLSYAVTAIPPNKILLGIPNYGYDWTLPFVQGSAAKTLSNTGAVELARMVKAAIKYDKESESPFYNYYDGNGKQHEVWFEDARSILAKLLLVNKYNLGGVSYWTIGRYFPQNWLVLRALYDVKKVL